MQFKRASVGTVAALAGLSSAVKQRAAENAVVEHVFIGEYTSTVYATSTSTILACGPGVTSCPASQTGVLTSIVPAYVTVCPYTSISTETIAGSAGSFGSGTAATITHFTTATITAAAGTASSGPSLPISSGLGLPSISNSLSMPASSTAAAETGSSSSSSTAAETGYSLSSSAAAETGYSSSSSATAAAETGYSSSAAAEASSSSVAAESKPSSAAATGITTSAVGVPGTDSTTTIHTTLSVTQTVTLPNGGGQTIVTIPGTYPDSIPALQTTSTASANLVGAVGTSGTGYLTPTNGTLSSQTAPPTSTLIPFEGTAQEIKGGIAGLLMAAAAFLL